MMLRIKTEEIHLQYIKNLDRKLRNIETTIMKTNNFESGCGWCAWSVLRGNKGRGEFRVYTSQQKQGSSKYVMKT